jgi:hypothetical protein
MPEQAGRSVARRASTSRAVYRGCAGYTTHQISVHAPRQRAKRAGRFAPRQSRGPSACLRDRAQNKQPVFWLTPQAFAAEFDGFAQSEAVEFCGESRRQDTRPASFPMGERAWLGARGSLPPRSRCRMSSHQPAAREGPSRLRDGAISELLAFSAPERRPPGQSRLSVATSRARSAVRARSALCLGRAR